MSHLVSIQTQLRDPGAIAAACERLKLATPVPGTAKLFSGEATGLLVQLPGWQYPVVIDTAVGTIKLDDYEGHWGDRKELDRLLQTYAVEKAKIEARRKGLTCNESVLQDGSIKLQITAA